jgi:hypothetical protein
VPRTFNGIIITVQYLPLAKRDEFPHQVLTAAHPSSRFPGVPKMARSSTVEIKVSEPKNLNAFEQNLYTKSELGLNFCKFTFLNADMRMALWSVVELIGAVECARCDPFHK